MPEDGLCGRNIPLNKFIFNYYYICVVSTELLTMLPPFSGLMCNPTKYSASRARGSLLDLLFELENGNRMFLRNADKHIRLHGVTSQKVSLVIVTAVRNSDPENQF
jgi:hypothetical protein